MVSLLEWCESTAALVGAPTDLGTLERSLGRLGGRINTQHDPDDPPDLAKPSSLRDAIRMESKMEQVLADTPMVENRALLASGLVTALRRNGLALVEV